MATTNKAIIELYKAEQGLPLDMPLFTWAVWHNMGYRVRKKEYINKHIDGTNKKAPVIVGEWKEDIKITAS